MVSGGLKASRFLIDNSFIDIILTICIFAHPVTCISFPAKMKKYTIYCQYFIHRTIAASFLLLICFACSDGKKKANPGN